jgi:hypothetical protein
MGVGMAVPERVNLLRVQALRGVGANAWRCSHNPPAPELLAMADALGVVVMDEHRWFNSPATAAENDVYLGAMRSTVHRDRNHPSVVLYSFCNEGGCDDGRTQGPLYRRVTKRADPTRAVTGNMINGLGKGLLPSLDVAGFSHLSGATFDSFKGKMPQVASECCSCRTQRGAPFATDANQIPGTEAHCISQQVNQSDSRSFSAGSFVWTGEWRVDTNRTYL